MVNITLFTNGSDGSILSFAQAINTASGGLFGLVLMVVVFIITFMLANKDGNSRNAFVTSAFISGLTAILLRLALIITDDKIVFVGILLIVIGALVLIFQREV